MPEGVARRDPERAVPVPRDVACRRPSARAQLFGSGAILPEVIKAQEMLEATVRRRRRRLERDELQRALSRRPRVRALEPAASGRAAARAVRDASA